MKYSSIHANRKVEYKRYRHFYETIFQCIDSTSIHRRVLDVTLIDITRSWSTRNLKRFFFARLQDWLFTSIFAWYQCFAEATLNSLYIWKISDGIQLATMKSTEQLWILKWFNRRKVHSNFVIARLQLNLCFDILVSDQFRSTPLCLGSELNSFRVNGKLIQYEWIRKSKSTIGSDIRKHVSHSVMIFLKAWNGLVNICHEWEWFKID